jgi:hypothetical protein
LINETIGPREDYANAQLTITRPAGETSRAGRQRYQFSFQITRWRYFDPYLLPVNNQKLLALAANPAAYGQALGKALLQKTRLGDDYREALAAVQSRGDGLRLRLVVEPPELQEILWERIFHPIAGEWHPLGSTAVTPFSRFILPQQWDRPAPLTRRPLRTLVVIASPTNLDSLYHLDPIDPAERQGLHQLFDQIHELAPVYLESGTSAKPNLNEIRKRLAEGIDLVHILCHGAHTVKGTALFLEGEDGNVDAVSQERFVTAFKVVQAPPVFCFLAACESAKRDRHDAMLPLGPALVADGGLQAVAAMTGKVGLKVAQQFAAQFYVRLLKHGVVDLAMNEARALVQDDWDWGVPVLFSRLEDNQLIDFPIGRITERFLSHTESAFQAIDEAVAAARLEQHGQELLVDLQSLVDELNKSNGLLVDIATRFRRTGRDPQDFASKFENFYYEFKAYYDGQTWVKEKTSCMRIGQLKASILPRLSPLLTPASFAQLRTELDLMSDADQDLLGNFSTYLDVMNTAVEGIWSLLYASKLDEAIQAKVDFEGQISPSFQDSKALFERMSHSIRGVSAA